MKITGSALPMLKQCQWWARPEVVAPPQPPPSEAMLVGTEVHAAIERVLTRGDWMLTTDDARDLFREWQMWWKMSPLAYEKWKAEVAYAYDTAKDTARFIGENVGRGYDTSATEIPGTIDALLLGDDHAIIIDWKTGSSFGHGPADAADNQQLRLYALMVARAHKIDTIYTHIVRITDQGVRQTSATLDAMDLDAVAEEVAHLVRAIPSSTPSPGGHCTRCRAVALCPSTTSAMAVVAPPEPVELKIRDPEQASALLLRLRQVQAACETMEAALREYAVNQGEAGIPLPNGKRWVRTSVDRESINLNGEANALGVAAISMAGAESALEAKVTTSKAAIERVFKSQGLKGKDLRDKVEGLMSELRAAGATRTTTVDAYREV